MHWPDAMPIKRRHVPSLLLVGLVLQSPLVAHALEQPNGSAIPSEMGCHAGGPTGLAAELACECTTPGVCNIGPPCSGPGNCPPLPSNECESSLWHSFNDNTCIPSNRSGLDPYNDASLEPSTFTPTCALTFTVVSRGTAIFGDVFGWYNVTGNKPQTSDLHVMLDCDAAKGESVVLDVRSDPDYAGGEIGFFIATPEGAGRQCAGGNCCASLNRVDGGEGNIFYSERGYNPDAAGTDSVIHLLVLDSLITERKFYFAWEDIFGGSNNDFTDLITSVEGVECSEGGDSCDTGEPGICGYGILTCESTGVECTGLHWPRDEKCDGADNDCDGDIDEGDVCHDDVVASCEGIECPAGQFCVDGHCADACAHVECGDGETCRGGACFPGCNQCNGIVCDPSESCDLATGHCLTDGDAPSGNADAGATRDPHGPDNGQGVAVGCGCHSGSGPSMPTALLWAFGFLMVAQRRRRTAPSS